jgi:C1A family cysteine protease
MRKGKLLFNSILFLILGCSLVVIFKGNAFDDIKVINQNDFSRFPSSSNNMGVEKPYEMNKNIKLSINDINSEEIKLLYDLTDVKIPSKFNLNDYLKEKYNITIPVANQDSLGLCDLFATMKSVETNYALKTGKYIDLSERYVDYMRSNYLYGEDESGVLGDDGKEGDGSSNGDSLTILETFGAPTEEKVPYKNYSKKEIMNLKDIKTTLRVTGTITFPYLQDVKDKKLKEKWMNILKYHVMTYGSINIPITAPDCEGTYNPETDALYYNEKKNKSSCYGHGVSIVGWDDNYSKKNFLIEPKGDGAFIILNSWGDDWADNGYAYISYYDDNLLVQATGVLDVELIRNYNEYTYSKKLFGASGYGVDDESRLWGIKFSKNKGNEYLSHITIGGGGFSQEIFNTKVKYYLNPIDDTFDKDKMILLGETFSIATGQHTNINLVNPIQIKGNKFALVFEFIGDEDDILLTVSKDAKDNIISGNMYCSKGFSSKWNSCEVDIPVYAFTVNE